MKFDKRKDELKILAYWCNKDLEEITNTLVLLSNGRYDIFIPGTEKEWYSEKYNVMPFLYNQLPPHWQTVVKNKDIGYTCIGIPSISAASLRKEKSKPFNRFKGLI